MHFRHTFEGITSIQVDIFFQGNLTFLDNLHKNFKNEVIPVNTANNKSGNPQEQLRLVKTAIFYSLEQRHKTSVQYTL